VFIWGGADTLASEMELTRARKVENVEVLASVREDAEGLVRKVAVLEVELVEVHRAREVAEEKFRSLSDALADGARWLVVSEMEHREQFEQFSLLRAWGAELGLTIIEPSLVRNPLSVRMWAGTLCHAMLVLGCSPYPLPCSWCWDAHLTRPLGWKS
jgi:hypothetical protein